MSTWAKGYQEALADLAQQLAEGGEAAARAWIRANSASPEVRELAAEESPGYCVHADGKPVTHWSEKEGNAATFGVCSDHVASEREKGWTVRPVGA